MAYYKVEEQELIDIAEAIREKTNNEEELSFPTGFIQSIGDIETSTPIELIPLTISTNDTYTAPEGKAYNSVHVDVPSDDTQLKALIDRSITTIEMPNGITSLGYHAFAQCKDLRDISLPDSITRIGVGAFAGCANIQEIQLPNNLIFIGNASFSSCEKLIIRQIPNSVETIENIAFYRCTRLTTITFKGTPSTIYVNVFGECTNLRHIYVPWSEGEVANAPWGATNATIHYNYTEEQP